MFRLHLAGFEGPLDLLLQLIEKSELDISQVSLVQVADQYLASLAEMKARQGAADAESLAEFIVIGARLMLLKSRALLPREIDPLFDEGDEGEDVGRELVQMLEEYRRYRDAVDVLSTIDTSGLRAFPARAVAASDIPPPQGLPDSVTLDLLATIVRDALTRAEAPARRQPEVALQREPVTVQDRIADLRRRLSDGPPVSFRAWIAEARTRIEVIVTFLAILELYKLRDIDMRQDHTYGDILVEAKRPLPAVDVAPAESGL